MSDIKMTYFENSEEDKHIFYGVKDAILDINYPNYCLVNSAGYKFARILFCTFPSSLSTEAQVHIHENMLVNLFNTDSSTASLNSTIQINLEAVAVGNRVVKSTVNATCSALKVNSLGVKDTDHRVIITEEEYTDSAGDTRYGIGVWIDIENYTCIATEPLYSMAANSTPIHKNYFNAFYIASYLDNDGKITDENLANIETLITNNQIATGIYDTDLAQSTIDTIQAKLNKVPDEYTQNTVYYSNTYTPATAETEEVITPYSVRGTFSEKIVSIDSINKAFKVLKNGYYAVQLRNGFYLAEGQESQLEMLVYKNTNVIKELGIQSYLIGGQKNTNSSNAAILHLTKSDAVYLKLIWSNVEITADHETFITIYPIQFD